MLRHKINIVVFCSKLFAKKLEKLFDSDAKNPDSPEDATNMFR